MGNAKEVEDFAERLRALKERSGRSYGSLATRLHVSTSTLHRYCNGDAVPADYAPVERFARLCGATPEELVALHRRWILADAAKRRARESAMSAPRGGEDAAGGLAADGTARGMDARSGGGEPRQSADVRGADAASDASGTTATPAAPPAADRHQGRVATPGPGPVTGPHPDAATGTGPAGDSSGGREAGARPRGAQPGAAADERHDTADPADASRATPMSDAHPAARRASAAADATSGRPGDDNGPDRSAEAHGTAHRGAAAHPNGDPHQRADTTDRADATDRTDGTLADATRTQPPGAPTADAEPPATGQAQPPRPWPPATDQTDGTRANNPRPRPPGARTGEAGPAPAAEAAPTAAAKTEPTSTGETGPPPAKRARLRAVAAGTTDTVTTSRARRPWALLAGAAAVVVLAVTAVEVRPPGDDGRKDTAAVPPSAAPTSTPPAGPTARGHLDRQRTDGDKESGSPRGGDEGEGEHGKERRAKEGASGSPAPGASKGTDHGGSTQLPLTLATRSHVWENGCGHRYLIDRTPTQVAPPPTEQDAPTWAAAHDAVHGGTTNVEVTVQGRASSAVVLQALHVRVVGRRTPLAWSSFAMDNGCGGSLTPRAFSVNLDAARPLARPTDGNDAGKPIPAVHFPYRVSASDPEVLLVNARTAGCDCSWYLELDWSSGSRSGTVRIDDHGSPFRTSSVKGRPAYAYDYTDGAWHKSD
ncbi:helix-turn-helix domain-containing protein [Streptomyces sp. DSM 41524]|uniref:Helix-turn-helix domain-containing protein n=1 Tax=Streptomyces asiaticus subsp. ignotus TaxID=3098222 RepID=A0ABU7PZ97_9ACTN|nr:helix-turn-helix domain-containing protein [Streptomyces sp. DSM 41524]